jgi:hypothetical protein
MDELDLVAAANQHYGELQKTADTAKETLFETWVTASRAGKTPEQIAEHCDFTTAYVRRIVRERGVPPLPRGPKRKAPPAE